MTSALQPLAIAALVLAPLCAPAETAAPDMAEIGADAGSEVFRIHLLNAVLETRYVPVAVGGRMFICGSYTAQWQGNDRFMAHLLKKFTVEMGGETILTGLDFFTFQEADGLVGRPGACRDTGRAMPDDPPQLTLKAPYEF